MSPTLSSLLLPKINKKRRKWDFKWANRRPGKGLMLSVTKCGWGEVAKPHFDSTIQKRNETLGTTTRWKNSKVHGTNHIKGMSVKVTVLNQWSVSRKYHKISKTRSCDKTLFSKNLNPKETLRFHPWSRHASVMNRIIPYGSSIIHSRWFTIRKRSKNHLRPKFSRKTKN